jgi:hypothetical protein
MTSTAQSPSEAKQRLGALDMRKIDKIKGYRETPKFIELLCMPNRSAHDCKTLELLLRRLHAFKSFPDFIAS